MPHAVPKLYPIADAAVLQRYGLTLQEGAALLLSTGVRWLQLRAKTLSSGEFLSAADEVVSMAQRFRAKIVINDRVDIAMASGADGAHLGQGDMDPRDARQLLGPEPILGWSTHSLVQGLEASKFPVDYVAVGPVADTTSKERPDPIVPPDVLPAMAGVSRVPLVAIGGIRPQGVGRVLGRGAHAVAAISSLWDSGSLPKGIAAWHAAIASSLPIALVGFMGVGKTAVGRLLADRTGCTFLDLDLAVERETGRSPAEWIRNEGEKAFRKVEARTLRGCLNGPAQGSRVVLACGGGVLETSSNADLLRDRAFTVWLEAPLPESLGRCSGADRPLLPERFEEVDRLYRRRSGQYERADMRLEVAGLGVHQVVEALRHLKPIP